LWGAISSDLVFVQNGGDMPWAVFGDAYAVDDKPVHGHDGNLERLLYQPSEDDLAKAQQLLEASSQHNVGQIVRSFNVPTFAVAFRRIFA
jgi:hypothetical protein